MVSSLIRNNKSAGTTIFKKNPNTSHIETLSQRESLNSFQRLRVILRHLNQTKLVESLGIVLKSSKKNRNGSFRWIGCWWRRDGRGGGMEREGGGILPMKGAQETSRIQKERAVREREVALAYGAQILASDVRVADGSCRQVQDSVAVVAYLGEELRHATLRPVLTHNWKNVTQHVRSEIFTNESQRGCCERGLFQASFKGFFGGRHQRIIGLRVRGGYCTWWWCRRYLRLLLGRRNAKGRCGICNGLCPGRPLSRWRRLRWDLHADSTWPFDLFQVSIAERKERIRSVTSSAHQLDRLMIACIIDNILLSIRLETKSCRILPLTCVTKYDMT